MLAAAKVKTEYLQPEDKHALERLLSGVAAGDRGALREAIETDPALDGLDRLYLQDVADKLIELHRDVLPRL